MMSGAALRFSTPAVRGCGNGHFPKICTNRNSTWKKTDTELFELTYILLRGISETKVCDVQLNMMEIPIRLISICIWAVKAAIAKERRRS